MAHTPEDIPPVPPARDSGPTEPLPADPADARTPGGGPTNAATAAATTVDAPPAGAASAAPNAAPTARGIRPRWQLIAAASVAGALLLGVGFAGGWGISVASGATTSIGDRFDRPGDDGRGGPALRPHDDGGRPFGDHDDDRGDRHDGSDGDGLDDSDGDAS